MIKKYLRILWDEIKQEPVPFFPAGVLLVAAITMTLAQDRHIISFLNSKFPEIQNLNSIRFYDIYIVVILFVLPVIYLKITGRKLKDFGMSFGRLEFAIPLFLLFFVSLTIIGYITSLIDSMRNPYEILNNKNTREILILFARNFILCWCWEFMFRGFLIQGLRKDVGKLAIFIQLIPYVILHLNKPFLEIYCSIIFGIFFGYYAYITGSFVYLAFLHAYYATISIVLR